MRRRHAASGMIEVLVLISVAVVGAGALAAWFSGAHDVLQGAECTAWIEAHEISDSTYWAQTTIRNTGDHPILEYRVMVGANDTPAASSHVVWEPGQTAILEFVVTDVDGESALLPARVIGRGAGGSALCEVVTP
ncbi:MAG: hypothetical protein OXP12_06895 [Thaumarchaeota archaeon]|nr:hypothetical protein [Nitrososphaerota archaeon]MDE0266594.1 hypothetical protein [Nitrososphaerota archaeon]